MAVDPHPDFGAIKKAVQKLSKNGGMYSGVCYRCTEPQFASQIVSGAGSQLYGARWNPKNSFPTVYLCETAESALQEYLARARRMKIPDHQALPMVMAWVKVKLLNMLDLNAPEVEAIVSPFLKTDEIHWRAIQDLRESASQAIGRAVNEAGFSGLIAPSSAQPNARIIVIFPRNLTPAETLSTPIVELPR